MAEERVPHPHRAVRRRTRPGGARAASRVDGVRRRRDHRSLDAHARALDRAHAGDHRRRARGRPLRRGARPTARSWRSASATSPRTPAVTARSGVRSMRTHYKTFPDLSAAARCIADQGGVSFIAHPYWSGMPLETLMAVEGAHGIELFNSSAQRENARGRLVVRLGSMPRPRQAVLGVRGPTTATTRASTSAMPGPWCVRPSAPRRRCSRRSGEDTPTRAPGRRSGRSTVDGTRTRGPLQPSSSGGHGVALRERVGGLAPARGTGWRRRRVLERDDRGLIVRARFSPSIELPHRRVVIEDEAGRKAWSNPI